MKTAHWQAEWDLVLASLAGVLKLVELAEMEPVTVVNTLASVRAVLTVLVERMAVMAREDDVR